jgi:hypothetical protein
MNNNSGLADTLKRKAGMEAAAVIDLHITDLLPPEPKPTAQTLSEYRLTEQDAENLTKSAVAMLKDKIK